MLSSSHVFEDTKGISPQVNLLYNSRSSIVVASYMMYWRYDGERDEIFIDDSRDSFTFVEEILKNLSWYLEITSILFRNLITFHLLSVMVYRNGRYVTLRYIRIRGLYCLLSGLND